MTDTIMTQLWLPWFDDNDALQISTMNLCSPDKICRRLARRLMRNWYKHNIGRSVNKSMLDDIWSKRHVSKAYTLENHIHQLARDTHDTTQECSTIELQEETNGDTG